MDFRLYVLALEAGSPKSGLALSDFAVNIYRVKKSDKSISQVVTNGDMEFEVGGGLYSYYLSAIDILTYDYFAAITYTGAESLDIKQWIASDFENAAREATLNFGIHANESGVSKTGLTLSDFQVNVYRVLKADKSITHLVTDGALTVEIGGGFYAYYLADCNFSAYDYLVTIEYTGLESLDSKLWYGEPVADIGTGGSALRDQVRVMLIDTSGLLLTNDELDNAITLALKEFSNVCPQRQESLLGTQLECHKNDDAANKVTTSDCSTTATAITLLEAIRTSADAHGASTTYHRAADTTNLPLTSPAATDLATAITLATEMIVDLTAHPMQAGVHMVNDVLHPIAKLAPVDEATLVDVANYIKTQWNAHLIAETNGLTLYANSVTGATGFIKVEAVQYPLNLTYPPFCLFDVLGDWLTLRSGYLPGKTGEIARVVWNKEHTVTTIPSIHESVVSLGAQGYAVQIKAMKESYNAVTDLATVDTHTASAATALANVDKYLQSEDGKNAAASLTLITTKIAELRDKVETANNAAAEALGLVTSEDIAGAADVWAEQVKHILTDANIPNLQDFLDSGELKIPGSGTGINEPEMWRAFAETAIKGSDAWAQKRADCLTQAGRRTAKAQIDIEEVASRLNQVKSYIEEAGGWDAIAAGFVNEADIEVKMANQFVGAATQQIELCKALQDDANGRLRTFRSQLTTIKAQTPNLKNRRSFACPIWG